MDKKSSLDQPGAETVEGPVRTVTFKVAILPAKSHTYSNASSISISPWDIRFNFADVHPQMDQPENLTEASVGITMPPEHAATLALLLMDQLHLFEQQFGAIRNPKWKKSISSFKGQLTELPSSGE